MIEFKEFPKVPRYNREIVITEKIDGTNAVIYIGEAGEFLTGSRTQWITPEKDNYNFSRWAYENKNDLLKLGVGYHYGEWWGSGIQRGYGLKNDDKRFSLFNTYRWLEKEPDNLPVCCRVVPVLGKRMMGEFFPNTFLHSLKVFGSTAEPGYMNPEGIVIFHKASNQIFKMTCDNDGTPKSKQEKEF